MDRLLIAHVLPAYIPKYGSTLHRLAKTDSEWEQAERWMETMLGTGMFHSFNAKVSLIEVFVRRADLEQPGPGGNDFVFQDAYTSNLER